MTTFSNPESIKCSWGVKEWEKKSVGGLFEYSDTNSFRYYLDVNNSLYCYYRTILMVII